MRVTDFGSFMYGRLRLYPHATVPGLFLYVLNPISYPESSGSLVSSWSSGETLGYWNLIFLAFFRVSPGNQPLGKELEDSVPEIVADFYRN